MRQIVWGSLPFGEGVVLDPFMGSGSTVAAAEALGYESIGIEIDKEFVELARKAISKLASIKTDWESFEGPNGNGGSQKITDHPYDSRQLKLV